MARYVIAVKSIAHHRNGVTGASFHAVLFQNEDGEVLLACVFEEPGHVAVIEPLMAYSGDISFSTNSWRGDVYEAELRAQIAAWEAAERGRNATIPLGAEVGKAVLSVITGGLA